MKKLALFCGMAALGLCAMNARAVIPNGYESVNFSATLTVYDGGESFKTVSMNNKDLLNLVAGAYFETLPSGAQLVKDGLDNDYFFILLSNGEYYQDASVGPGGDYELYFEPWYGYSYEGFVSGTSDTYNWVFSQGYFYYESYDGDYFFRIYGLTTDKINYDNDDESYSMPHGAGNFEMPVGYYDEGVLSASFSGSGSHVDDPY